MGGRPPKPSLIKKITGNPGMKVIKEEAFKPRGNLVNPPKWFSESQREVWEYALENSPLGLLKRLDREALIIWCTATDAHREAAILIQKEGVLDSNGARCHPAINVMQKQAEIMLRTATQLGFTPSARARITTEEKAEDDSPLAQFLTKIDRNDEITIN